jgi:hypothetical protein
MLSKYVWINILENTLFFYIFLIPVIGHTSSKFAATKTK